MILGFHAVEATGDWDGRDLEEAMAFGGVCAISWLMIEAAALGR